MVRFMLLCPAVWPGALHVYWRGEYEASAHLIYPKIGAAARMLLLELDEAVYRTQVGSDQGGYGGLYGLLTALEQQGMDEDWSFFLRWLLLGPTGVNLHNHNDLSHGLVLDRVPYMQHSRCARPPSLSG
jgi:hypothetical protein